MQELIALAEFVAKTTFADFPAEVIDRAKWVLRDGRTWKDRGPVVICLSGRGDKDVAHVARVEGRGPLL